MRRQSRLSAGYSLPEAIVVLAIVGALAVAGYLVMSDNRAPAVKSIIEEIEGVLVSAQRNTLSGTGDVVLISRGIWKGANEAASLLIDGRRFDPVATGDVYNRARVGSPVEVFRSMFYRERRHQVAGVDTSGGSDYLTAIGSAVPNLSSDLAAALATPLCPGTDNNVVINGYTKRFSSGFYIAVIGLRNGSPVPNGPVGLLVVPANSTGIFKFYKAENDTTWRRM